MNLRDRLTTLRAMPANAGPPTTSLAERVARMAAGARSKAVCEDDIARQLQGTRIADGVVRIDHSYRLQLRHGKQAFEDVCGAPLQLLGLNNMADAERLVFLDTETSGLSGGAGTIAFLLGLARIEDQALELRQWLLLGFRGEAAMLEDASAWLGGDRCLISFNGKSFDVPLLVGRYRLHRMSDPFRAIRHLDLVHPLRRAFSGVWDDCRLQTAEQKLLGLYRQDDLPGALVPEVWSGFLRHGELGRVPEVLTHNRIDILTLPALAAALASLYANPTDDRCNALAIAKHHLAEGRPDHALRVLGEREGLLDEAGLLMLASLLRRAGRGAEALRIWEDLAGHGLAAAHETLAKYHEHRSKDYAAALGYAQQLAITQGESAVQHRLVRLKYKLARRGDRLI